MAGGFIALLIVALVLYGIGAIAGWFMFRRKYPELREFRHLGLASLLTGGLVLLTSWAYLLTDLKRIRQDPVLRNWIAKPLAIFGATYALEAVSRLLLPASAASGVQHALMLVDGVAGLWMLVRGWSSSDELIRFSSRKNFQVILWAIFGAIWFLVADPHSVSSHPWRALAGVVGIGVCVNIIAYLLVQQVLATLVASTRNAAEPRRRMWVPLVVLAGVVYALPLVATCVHAWLAPLVA